MLEILVIIAFGIAGVIMIDRQDEEEYHKWLEERRKNK